jgi:hypothetical protein
MDHNEESVEDIFYYPPANPKDSEYNTVKFYTFSSILANNISFSRTLVIIVICIGEVVVNSFSRTLVIIVICIGEGVVNSFSRTLVIIAIYIGPVILECIP